MSSQCWVLWPPHQVSGRDVTGVRETGRAHIWCPVLSPLSSLITVSTGGLVVQLPLFRERRVLLGNYNSIIVSGQMYRMAAPELNCNTTGKMIALLSGLQLPLNININESYI